MPYSLRDDALRQLQLTRNRSPYSPVSHGKADASPTTSIVGEIGPTCQATSLMHSIVVRDLTGLLAHDPSHGTGQQMTPRYRAVSDLWPAYAVSLAVASGSVNFSGVPVESLSHQ
jgi:hypothetical protein